MNSFKPGPAITADGSPAFIQTVDGIIEGWLFHEHEWKKVTWRDDGTVKAAGKDSEIDLEPNFPEIIYPERS